MGTAMAKAQGFRVPGGVTRVEIVARIRQTTIAQMYEAMVTSHGVTCARSCDYVSWDDQPWTLRACVPPDLARRLLDALRWPAETERMGAVLRVFLDAG